MVDQILQQIHIINAAGGRIRIYARGMNLAFSERHSHIVFIIVDRVTRVQNLNTPPVRERYIGSHAFRLGTKF